MSIRSQIQTLLLGALVFGIFTTTSLVTGFFSGDLKGLTRRMAFDASLHLASRIQNEIKTATDMARWITSGSLQDFRYAEDRDRFLRESLKSRPQVYALTLFEATAEGERRAWNLRWRLAQETISGAELQTLDQSLRRAPHDGRDARQIMWMRGLTSRGVDLIRLVFPMIRTPQGRTTHLMAMDLRVEPWKDLFANNIDTQQMLVDESGSILAASPDVPSLAPSVLAELKKTGLKDVEDVHGTNYFAAHQTISLNVTSSEMTTLTLITLTPEANVSYKIIRIVRRATWLAAIFLIATFLFGTRFARALSLPIRALAEAAAKVKNGDFSVRMVASSPIHPPELKTRNEIDQLSVVFDQMVLGLQERDRLKTTFSKFHGIEIADNIMRGELRLGGERREGIVFFSDIRGFTRLSEELSPESIVHLLNRYFGLMVEIIHRHGGIVDKYIGDAILAVWGVPTSKPDDAVRALRACLEMRHALTTLNDELARENLPPIKIGMGLNFGNLVAGNIGSEARMEYTVIGDTVNTANRIEAATKDLETDLLISESVVQRLGSDVSEFKLEPIESEISVKGKNQALRLYKITGPT